MRRTVRPSQCSMMLHAMPIAAVRYTLPTVVVGIPLANTNANTHLCVRVYFIAHNSHWTFNISDFSNWTFNISDFSHLCYIGHSTSYAVHPLYTNMRGVMQYVVRHYNIIV